MFTLQALHDHQDDGDEIGEEEASNCQRDDGVECHARTDIDQANRSGERGAEKD